MHNLLESRIKTFQTRRTRRKFKNFEPFVLAMQATQVCYMQYPSIKRDNSDWLAVCKVKPRGWVDVENRDNKKEVAFQEDEVEANDIVSTEEPTKSLLDATVGSDDISNNDSDDESNDVVEGEFEYTTSTDEQDDEGDNDQFNDDGD
ncbi:hypothetical protein LXL04_033983 [Taraxacum kok-saghyz]